ncbi:hypothetical protein DL98DRAFT_643691 [Cadophora sp. DSE1049]|nr:hypothetical protein DL98DRAFT_643691 [Cadophora sp. DSE1049]
MEYRPLHGKPDDEDVDDDRRHKCSFISRYLPSERKIMIAIITALLSLLFIISTSKQSPDSPYERRTINGYYTRNQDYMTLDPAADFLWEPMITEVFGIIRISDAPSDVAAISMFHQMHCIASFRKALQNARSGIDIGIDQTDDPHWPHCLHYMLQTVLCFADDTLERPGNGSSVGAINGYNDQRKCRSSEELYNRLNSEGIAKAYFTAPDGLDLRG